MKLKGSGAISDQQIESYRNQAAVAKARFDAKTFNYATRRLPHPMMALSAHARQRLGRGNCRRRIIPHDFAGIIKWRGELTAAQLAYVESGQPVELILPDGSAATATVRQTSPSLDSTLRMATVYAHIEAGSRAHAGMYATGTILRANPPAMFVPGSKRGDS